MTGRRVRHAGAALLAASAIGPGAARARAAEGGVEVTWRAPAGCPDRDAIVRRMADALADGRPGLGAGWRVHGSVQAGRGSGWVLVLELRAPGATEGAPPARRVLSAVDCDELGEAAAVAIAIALDDASASESAEAAAGQERPPTPSRSEPPLALPADPASDRSVNVASSGRARDPLRVAFAAEGVLDSASLGGLGWGASIELSAWWRRFGVGGYGIGLAPRATELGAGQQAEFSLLGGGLRLCYRAPADWLWVSPCIGLEAARFSAHSAGLRAARDAHDLWSAAAAGLAFGSSVLGAMGVHSRVELVLPTSRQEYLVDDAVIHRVPAATLRWMVGIDAGG
jgi:hypothetical protein